MRISTLALHAGERIPKWYGIAYWEYKLDCVIAYPIPLNLIVALGLKVWWWVKSGAWDKQLHQAFSYGWNKGYNEGYNEGRHQLERKGLIVLLRGRP